jgi:inner membrane protein involved in colicin E2 resistance
MAKTIAAIVSIYVCTAIAWLILGSTMLCRTTAQDCRMKGSVDHLWGSAHIQKAPLVYYRITRDVEVKKVEKGNKGTETRTECVSTRLPVQSSNIEVDLSLQYRKKGLLWYSTYRVRFSGEYAVMNNSSAERNVYIQFEFPDENALYDDFRFMLDGRQMEKVQVDSGRVCKAVALAPGKTTILGIYYNSQGSDQWWYNLGDDVSQVMDFSLKMNTDFDQIDFPEGGISPTDMQKKERGWLLQWDYANLFTGARIGMQLPRRLNPGPWVGHVTFSAPISLFLFFFLLLILTILKGVRIHPINYFFVAAAFFSFHLLLAYLVDHLSIHAAFFLSAAISIFLVITYMRLVVGRRFAFVEVAISQFVYLVLFSYTFFFRGFTGLAITALCIVTLFITMQLTGRLNWSVFLGRGES